MSPVCLYWRGQTGQIKSYPRSEITATSRRCQSSLVMVSFIYSNHVHLVSDWLLILNDMWPLYLLQKRESYLSSCQISHLSQPVDFWLHHHSVTVAIITHPHASGCLSVCLWTHSDGNVKLWYVCSIDIDFDFFSPATATELSLSGRHVCQRRHTAERSLKPAMAGRGTAGAATCERVTMTSDKTARPTR